MPPVLVLLSLLVGSLEVHAVPLDNGIRPEEKVTRCIVEVLSNALAKPNAPPIDPECKEILKKSSQHNLDEKEDEQQQYETRNIKDFGDMDKHQYESNEEVKKSKHLTKEEDEEKRHHDVEDESKEEKEEEKKHEEDKEESIGHSKERGFFDDDEEDGDDEEAGDHKNHNEKEIEKKDKHHHDDSQEVKHDISDKQIHQTAKNVEEFSEEDEEPNHLEEILKRHPISQNPKERFFHSDKYHTVHSDEMSEESDEKEGERKRNYNPKHDDFAQRFLDYEEKRNHPEEQWNYSPTDEDFFHYRGQQSRFGQNPFENNLKNDYEKKTHHEIESSEESREKRHHHQDSKEEKDHRDSNDESNERVLTGHHYEDQKHHSEIKRWPSQKNSQPSYDQSNEDSEESKEDIEKRHKDDRLELYKKLKHHLQDSEEDRSYKPEKKQEDKRHYIGEEVVDKMKRYFPDLAYEKKLRQVLKNKYDSNYHGNDKYKRHHSEEETRSFSKYAIPKDPFRWNNRYFESNDNSGEERKRSLQNKNLFSDYDDYDLWGGKKQFLDDINHEYGEKRNPLKIPKLEEKRQYDRMDELAQLLNYKKKSVEFPDFYDSEEIKKRHYSDQSRLHQRPLTEEEEKELENLAVMDLELQKIAEKLSNNRQG